MKLEYDTWVEKIDHSWNLHYILLDLKNYAKLTDEQFENVDFFQKMNDELRNELFLDTEVIING